MRASGTVLVIAVSALLLAGAHSADAAAFTLTPETESVDSGGQATLKVTPSLPTNPTYKWLYDQSIKNFVKPYNDHLDATIQPPGTYSFTIRDITTGQIASNISTITVRDVGPCAKDESGVTPYPCRPACGSGEVWIRPPQKCRLSPPPSGSPFPSGSTGVCCAPAKPPGATCMPGDACRVECIRPESLSGSATKTCNDGWGSVLCCSPSQFSIPTDVVSIGIATPKKVYRPGEEIDPRVTVRRFDSRVRIVRFKLARVLPGTAAVDIPQKSCSNNTTPATVTFGASPSPGPYDNIRTSGDRCGEFAINTADSRLVPGNYTLTATITEISSGNGTANDIKDPITFNNTSGTLVTIAETNSVVPELPLPFALATAAGVLFTIRAWGGRKQTR